MTYYVTGITSVSISFVQSALSNVNIAPERVDEILQAVKVPRHLIGQGQARIALDQLSQLMTQLMLAADDEFLGYAKRPLPVGGLSVLVHWLVATQCLHQSIVRFVRFIDIIDPGFRLKVCTEGDALTIAFKAERHTARKGVWPEPFLIEFTVFILHRLLCWLRKELIKIEGITFSFSEPVYSRDYRLMFFGAPIAFDAHSNEIRFNRRFLNKAVKQRSTDLKNFLRDPNSALLTLQFNEMPWSLKVAQRIAQSLSVESFLPQIASSLGIKPHTLRRRLADEGRSFSEIKSQVKRDKAIELLITSDMSIECISQQLGFSEVSPFTRAFKLWTGFAPSEYRKSG